MANQSLPTLLPEHFRAELARHRIKLYTIAAAVGLHPSYLGGMLNGRRPLPLDVAERPKRALAAYGTRAS
jgi:hypothetical protein